MSQDQRLKISSGAPWEAQVGYSRAVRVGNWIGVAGTTAVEGDQVVGVGDAAVQTRTILEKIQRALALAGGRLEDVVRTRIFVTDMGIWPEVARVHGDFFRDIRPAATLVQVAALIRPELWVEIEADAIISTH